MPKAKPSPSLFQNCVPDYVAVVLASSEGSRLFPVTSSRLSKHLMPICGVSVISRLLSSLQASGFQETVVVLAQDDKMTIPHLKEWLLREDENNNDNNKSKKEASENPLSGTYQIVQSKPHLVLESSGGADGMKISVLPLHEDCSGSIEALRKVEEADLVPSTSHMMVLPGDLVVLDPSVLRNLCDAHRQQGYQGRIIADNTINPILPTACSVLLADVGEVDEHGVPLKESAKQKRGGVARDEEDIEYIALSYNNNSSSLSPSAAPRLVWKQLKIDVHDNEAMVAETPKLMLPKSRLRVGGMTRVRTDWSDRHSYIFSPWVRRLIVERKSLMTVQGDLLPLLVSRQFQGIEATFGSKVKKDVVQDVLLNSPDLVKTNLAGPTEGNGSKRGSAMFGTSLTTSGIVQDIPEYAVLAHIQSDALRTNTIASYLHACRELLTIATTTQGGGGVDQGQHHINKQKEKNPGVQLPVGTSVRSKFHSILLPEASTGDKVTFKSACVGRRCKLGNKCRLNNVVIMDDVTIGDNVILQNSIVGSGCKIGDNCNLNDCQIAPGKEIPSGEKAKGESYSI